MKVTVKQFIAILCTAFILLFIPAVVFNYTPPNECVILLEDRQRLIITITSPSPMLLESEKKLALQTLTQTDSLIVKCGCK